jgi:predicted transcriptional regulator
MKSVLISIQPKWCELIANGSKTIEVRKTKPKLKTPFKVYIYCTQGRERSKLFKWCRSNNFLKEKYTCLNGKVIGEFVCDYIEPFTTDYRADREQTEKMSKLSCVSWLGMNEYEANSLCLYGWHISDLVIYDKPRELSEFRKPELPTGLRYEDDAITRPPQSWCYVESEVEGE